MRSIVEHAGGHVRHPECTHVQAIHVLSQVRSVISVRRFDQDAKEKSVTRKVGATVWTSKSAACETFQGLDSRKAVKWLMSWFERPSGFRPTNVARRTHKNACCKVQGTTIYKSHGDAGRASIGSHQWSSEDTDRNGTCRNTDVSRNPSRSMLRKGEDWTAKKGLRGGEDGEIAKAPWPKKRPR